MTTEYLTIPEAYKIIATHLYAQGARSEDNGRCQYRVQLSNGSVRSCAVGCLFTAEGSYDEAMENNAIETLFQEFPDKMRLARLDPTDMNMLYFLEEMQIIHDQIPLERWEGHLVDYAKADNLTPITRAEVIHPEK